MTEDWWRDFGEQTRLVKGSLHGLTGFASAFVPKAVLASLRTAERAIQEVRDFGEECMWQDLQVDRCIDVDGDDEREWFAVFYGGGPWPEGAVSRGADERPPRSQLKGVEATDDQWAALAADTRTLASQVQELVELADEFECRLPACPARSACHWDGLRHELANLREHVDRFVMRLPGEVSRRGGPRVVAIDYRDGAFYSPLGPDACDDAMGFPNAPGALTWAHRNGYDEVLTVAAVVELREGQARDFELLSELDPNLTRLD